MNFRQAEEYLLSLELFGMRFGLDRMHRLMTVLGLPQRRFASIHVVGTNGKSSTVRFCAAILERHGLRSGQLHVAAPELVPGADRGGGGAGVRGRLRGGGRPAPPHAAELVNRTAEPDDQVTQFEALTAAAYHELARSGVEVAVIEAGLGGRFDATNVIPSKVQVLTSVGLEHTRWLGPTARATSPRRSWPWCATTGRWWWASSSPSSRAVAERVAAERRARSCRRRRRPRPRCAPPAASSAATSPWPRPPPRRSSAAPSTRTRCSAPRPRRSCPAASSWWPSAPLTVYDGAHNPAGARVLAESLDEVLGDRRPRVAVIGVLEDKDAAAMLAELLPRVRPGGVHALAQPALAVAGHAGVAGREAGRPARGDRGRPARGRGPRARRWRARTGAVLATGSIYLIADLVRERSGARASTL